MAKIDVNLGMKFYMLRNIAYYFIGGLAAILSILLYPEYSLANNFDPEQLPSVQITSTISNTEYLPDLKWIIEEGASSLSPELLSSGRLKDGQLLDLSSNSSFEMSGDKNYWFNLQINELEAFKQKVLQLYRVGNCWPWEMTFFRSASLPNSIWEGGNHRLVRKQYSGFQTRFSPKAEPLNITFEKHPRRFGCYLDSPKNG